MKVEDIVALIGAITALVAALGALRHSVNTRKRARKGTPQ